jgi:hypothetical protein
MKELDLLASAALFSELYNSNHDVADIIAEFIKSTVVSEKKWTVTSTELEKLINESYSFKIPESVLRNTINTKLKKVVAKGDGVYHFNQEIEKDFQKFDDDFKSLKNIHETITTSLFDFIAGRSNSNLNELQKQLIQRNFYNYLLDDSVTEEYSKLISVFIIKNKNPEFTEQLNKIREGIILYQGVRFTAGLERLGEWTTEIKIFLGLEHLFNAAGFNGQVFEKIFDDFFDLVTKINAGKKNKFGEGLVQLHFLKETQDQLTAFFNHANDVLAGRARLDYSKSALRYILDGAKQKSDILKKKVSLEDTLRRKHITLKTFNHGVYDYPEFVVDNPSVIDEMEAEAKKRGGEFDRTPFEQAFKIFTRINYIRGGHSKTDFEHVAAIYVTEQSIALRLAHLSKVKFQDRDIPFVKGIDFITSNFWFKLKKGFNDKNILPISFDVITKAQLVLSAQVNQSVSNTFKKLIAENKAGELTNEAALDLLYALREKAAKPEDITDATIDMSLTFLETELQLEDIHREKIEQKSLLAKVTAESLVLKEELERRDQIDEENRLKAEAEQRRIERHDFATKQWQNYKNERWIETKYFAIVTIITAIPIFITLGLKLIPALENLSVKATPWLTWIIAVFIVVYLVELLGRSYLFNKDKVKRGAAWIGSNIYRPIYSEIRNNKMKEFYDEFDK